MNLKLNTWQIVLLFIPLVMGFLSMIFADTHWTDYKLSSPVINLLLTLTEVLIVSYQAYLTINFLNSIESPSPIFRINTLIIPIISVAYFFYRLYCGFDHIVVSTNEKIRGPIKIAEMSTFSRAGTFFLYYLLLNYFFINNKVVSHKLKVMPDAVQRQILIDDFLVPLKSLVRISIWVIASMLAISLFADILRYTV